MNWRDYETAVFKALRSRLPTDDIRCDVSIRGRYSEVDRQVDVAGRSTVLGHVILGIADCKCYSRNVDVKDVEAVIGMAADVRASVALIITTEGYSEAALARARNEPNVGVHLDILTINEAVSQSASPAVAFMYRGRIGATVLAPSGWLATSNIVDGKRVLPFDALCYFCPNDVSPEEAARTKRVGWCHIEDNPNGRAEHLETVLNGQRLGVLNFDQESEFSSWSESRRGGQAPILFRRINYKTAGYIDLTFFVDLEGAGLFWACMACPPNEEQEALGRLRFIAENMQLAYAPTIDPMHSDAVWQAFFPWQK